MHRSSRAPVLSATRSLDSCWITGVPPCRSCSLAAKSKPGKDAGSARSRRLRARLRTPHGAALQRAREREMRGGPPSLLGGLHDLHEAPALRLRERSRLDDADDVADVRAVLLVVRVELRAAADDLLVARVRLDRVDLDDDRLVHRAGDDDAAALLAAAALGLRLRCPRDRLALGRALPHRLRALATLRAGDVLGLLLLFRDGGRFGRRRLGSSLLGCSALLGAGGTSRFRRSPLPRSAVADGLLRSLFFRGLFGRLVVLFFSHLAPSQLRFALDAHREDARDLPLRELQPRAVLERARRGLEAQVEQLLPPVGQGVLQLVVAHVPQVPSFQRDPPPASRTSSSVRASSRRAAALPSRATRARRRART